MYCMLSSSFTKGVFVTDDVLKGRSVIFLSGLTKENPLVLLSVHNLFPEGLEKWPSCRPVFPYLRTPGQSVNS